MLVEKIQEDLKQAQINRDEVKVSTLRLLLSEVKYAQIQKRDSFSDQDIITVVQKELKKRKEAAAGFRQGQREEQALKEESEAKILEGFLPEQISDLELTKIVEQSIVESGASSPQEMGKVIGIVMAKVGQSAEGSRVSSLVSERLIKSQ